MISLREMLGITPDNCSEAITKGADFEVYKTAAGTEVTLNKKQCEQRRKLVDQIHARGFEAVVEEVAYTWFNRICAIRFMEVNDYMYPVRVRVLSSEKKGKNEPDVVTMVPEIDWDFTDKEREEIIDAKMNNRLDDLFRMLFIKQCNLLHEVLPGLFEETEDYTEMLLNISFTNEADVIRMLVDGIDEKDFNITTVDEDGKAAGQVEIIGWLYQYYNTEPKNKAFAKKAKITKEEIPAVTQLFTPDWIVRYMVENSLGRMWLEGHPDEELKSKWKYYLDEAEQEESVQHELNKIKAEYATLKPEDIKLIDPCMGSGHILVYAFDVFMQIYENAGWSQRDAAQSIIQNNIYGLDIDDRAAQLSYFAVLMKARQYDRRILTRGIEPNVYAVQESNGINRGQLKYFGVGLVEEEKNASLMQIEGLLNILNDAKEYGSLLNVEDYDWELLEKFVENTDTESQISFETYGLDLNKLYVDTPVGADIFKVAGGGQNYVHGGTSLQEMIVPVIELTTNTRGVAYDYVDVVLTSVTRKVTNLITYFDFIQTEKVTDTMKARSIVAYFTTEDGEKISFDVPMIANSREDAPEKRTFHEKFTLKSREYKHGDKYYLVLADANDENNILQQYEFMIDIAFVDDFGF